MIIASVGAGVLGLFIGSLLNVAIYSIPKAMQREFDEACIAHCGDAGPGAERGGSAVSSAPCYRCGYICKGLENVALVRWAFGGKCVACDAATSLRYPAVELLTGLLSAFLVWQFGIGSLGLAVLVFGFLVIAMAFIDLDTHLLPDELTYPLLWLGLVVNLNGALVPLVDAVIGAVAGYMVLWCCNELHRLATGAHGMGHGDFKLLGALGAWVGWTLLPSIVLLSAVGGAAFGIIMRVFGRHGRGTLIPFGPYLAGAGLITLVYGPQIRTMMQRYLG